LFTWIPLVDRLCLEEAIPFAESPTAVVECFANDVPANAMLKATPIPKIAIFFMLSPNSNLITN